VVRQIRDEFPLFGYVDANLRRMTRDFLEILPFQGWSDHIYANLKPQRIEEILFYEKTAASLEFFDLRSIRKEVSQIYDGLGDFYALKCLHEQLPADLGRCKFYPERATLADPENFGAWNDRGWVALVLEQPANYALARQYSEVSLKINSHQQRALYNLSVSEHHDGKFALAEELLTRAVREENWQEKKYAGRLHNLYYNRACARGRLAQDPASDPQKRDPGKLLGEAMEDFKEALGIARLGSWDLDDWNYWWVTAIRPAIWGC
jgi:tetratricopeptide (TPR) repeat protein